MKQKSKTACIVGLIILIGIGISMGIQHQEENNTEPEVAANSGLAERTLTIGDRVIAVEVAQTPEQRATGLSHRTSLEEGSGMLFIFGHEGKHGIWMKDMHFPIDIVWIDAAMKVVHIERAVSPNTYPKSFAPPIPARYVLEVPAGYTQGNIALGETIVLD